jgi:hypothetical protein
MPRGQPILQNLSQILSKLICSPTLRDNFMETPSNFAKPDSFMKTLLSFELMPTELPII